MNKIEVRKHNNSTSIINAKYVKESHKRKRKCVHMHLKQK